MVTCHMILSVIHSNTKNILVKLHKNIPNHSQKVEKNMKMCTLLPPKKKTKFKLVPSKG